MVMIRTRCESAKNGVECRTCRNSWMTAEVKDTLEQRGQLVQASLFPRSLLRPDLPRDLWQLAELVAAPIVQHFSSRDPSGTRNVLIRENDRLQKGLGRCEVGVVGDGCGHMSFGTSEWKWTRTEDVMSSMGKGFRKERQVRANVV